MNNKERSKHLRMLYVKYLMSSYLYYHKHVNPPWSDHDYDAACRDLIAGWDDFEHEHKYLTDKEALRSGTAYHIAEYPTIVKVCAFEWLKEEKNNVI